MPRMCLRWMGVEEAYMQLRSLPLLPATNYGRKKAVVLWPKWEFTAWAPRSVAKSDDLYCQYEFSEISLFLVRGGRECGVARLKNLNLSQAGGEAKATRLPQSRNREINRTNQVSYWST